MAKAGGADAGLVFGCGATAWAVHGVGDSARWVYVFAFGVHPFVLMDKLAVVAFASRLPRREGFVGFAVEADAMREILHTSISGKQPCYLQWV